MILFYYKLRDNLHDAGIRKKAAAFALLLYVSRMHKKAARRQPEVEAMAGSYIEKQHRAESGRASVDEAAHPTAEMMSSLLKAAADDRANERVTARLGYFLGRWVYFCDAADDLKDDLETGDFNPFAAAYGLHTGSDLTDAREKIRMLLNMCHYEICAAFELLEIKRFKPILANIVYLGLPDTEAIILKGEKLRPV